jgi:gamma-glutamyl-gamma-aminobutyrate hydrolase PuuD
MVPLIGITTYVADASWSSWVRRSAVLPASYFELVAAAGGRPLLLPPLSTAPDGPSAGAADAVAVLDGLILTGGGDVDPAAYGEVAQPTVAGVNPVRDDSERALLAAALAIDLPVLAICRGLQVLNIELGGTLHQHVPDLIGADTHRTAPLVFGEVGVSTTPGSRAEAVFGSAPTVLCSHHQSLNDLGRGLEVTARSPDGVIEAVELPAARFVLGVQWHPEEGSDGRPFRALVDAASAYRDDRADLARSRG